MNFFSLSLSLEWISDFANFIIFYSSLDKQNNISLTFFPLIVVTNSPVASGQSPFDGNWNDFMGSVLGKLVLSLVFQIHLGILINDHI